MFDFHQKRIRHLQATPGDFQSDIWRVSNYVNSFNYLCNKQDYFQNLLLNLPRSGSWNWLHFIIFIGVREPSKIIANWCFRVSLRNRKHIPCFYRVIETRVEVWDNEKCCGNTSRRRVFPQLFWVLSNFPDCFYNSIETRSTCFLFLLENTASRKRKTICLIWLSKFM